MNHASDQVGLGVQASARLGRARLGTLDAAAALADGPFGAGLIHRQTAIALNPGLGVFRPLFHALSFNYPALTAQAQAQDAAADPFLLRHLAARLDPAMRAFAARLCQEPGLAVHLPQTLAGLEPAAFSAACRPLGVELALLEAVADPDGFAVARRRLAAAGVSVVLDGVSPAALRLLRLHRLGADLVKLAWSPELARQVDRGLIAAIGRIGPARVLLDRADTESALRWGLALGIRGFQGRHVDAMLAAGRITACPGGPRCSLAQCSERAAATLPAARMACANPALLEAGAPP